MSLDEYWRKRAFERTPEPRGAGSELDCRHCAGSWCNGTGPAGSTTTCAWRSTACSSAGPCRADLRWARSPSAAPRAPRTTRSSTSTSRASSRPASTAAAMPSSGTTAPGSPELPDDPVASVEAGELKFVLHGERLAGRFVIVRTDRERRGAWSSGCSSTSDDEHASEGWDIDDYPTSVLSGRTNDEVAARAPAAEPRQGAPAGGPRPGGGAASRGHRAFISPCWRRRWTGPSATPTGCSS